LGALVFRWDFGLRFIDNTSQSVESEPAVIYQKLFTSFFQIGLFSFGGGYASMPLIQQQVVEKHGWLTLSEFADVITISQMTPGPIAINSSTFVGMRIAGIPGAIIATLGCILPSCIIVLALAFLYQRYKNLSVVKALLAGLRPAVVALIASAGVSILVLALWKNTNLPPSFANFNFIGAVLFLGAFYFLRFKKTDPIQAMLGSGVVGLIIYWAVGP